MKKFVSSGIVLLFILSVSISAHSAPQKIWGLCIGISDYNLPDLALKWADKDAIEFSTFLRYGLGLPEDQYRILKNREATRENIRDAFGWLSLVVEPEDRVYIFYSGHGKDNSPIVPYDTDNLFSLESIKKTLAKIEAREIIFFADACYSGRIAGKGAKAIIRRENMTGLDKDLISEIAQAKTGTVIMTSANGIQEAYEWDGQKNGLFTYHLMNTLMDQSLHAAIDLDQNGELTLYEVYQNVRDLVASESEQEPQLSDPEAAKAIVLVTTSSASSEPGSGIPETSPPTPEVSEGTSSGTKVALGLGAAALLGGGVALIAGSDSSSSEPSPPPDVENPENVEAVLIVSPMIQTSCGSVLNSLYVTNLNNTAIMIERIDYEENLLLDEPPTSCQQGRRGSFFPDVTIVRPNQWALVRQWEHESYPCSGCPYRFSECSYTMNYTIKTSVGTVPVEPVTTFVYNGNSFCPTTGITGPPGTRE